MQNGTALAQFEGLVAAGRWQWDVRTNQLHWSPQLARIFGLRPGQAPDGYVGFLELVYPDDRALTEQVVEQALEQRRNAEYRHRIVRADGEVRVLRSQVFVDTDGDGEVIRLSGACQDVTPQVAAEERLRRLQGLAVAGNIAAGLAHDLNNMLGGILLLGDMLGRHEGDPARAMLADLNRMAKRAAEITGRIQGMAKHVPARRTRLDLRRELEDLVSGLSTVLAPRHQVVLHVGEEVGSTPFDRTDLARVIWNLVLNAAHAQREGGPIVLTAERIVVVDDDRRGPYYRITVEDRGEGMDEESCARLFEPLYTTKTEGTGLGLAVVFDIVEDGGGFVTAESRLGEGTRIRLHLPVAP